MNRVRIANPGFLPAIIEEFPLGFHKVLLQVRFTVGKASGVDPRPRAMDTAGGFLRVIVSETPAGYAEAYLIQDGGEAAAEIAANNTRNIFMICSRSGAEKPA